MSPLDSHLFRRTAACLALLPGLLACPRALSEENAAVPENSAAPAITRATYQTPPAYSMPTGILSTDPSGGQFAGKSTAPCLPRLGPHPGACEVGWFHGHLWFEAEYLAWETKGANFPALLTTGASSTPTAAGALDQADTSILFGNTRLHDDYRSGGRFTVGYWLTLEQEIGFEASLMGIDGRDIELVVDSSDYPVLARPYTDGVNGDEDSLLIAYPGLLVGSTRIDADMELMGGEVLMRKALLWRTEGRVDLLAGYRHGYLRDQLTIHDYSLSLDAASGLAPGSELFRDDLFSVKNYFNGGELGLSTRLWRGCWSCNLTTKGAYGSVLTRSTITGDTTLVTDPGGIPIYQHDEGGLLGLPTNSGYRKFSEDAFLGELGVTLECQVSTNSRIALGYTFFYWDSLMRLAPLIDTNINPTQIPPGTLAGPALPAFTLQREDFWAQGLNLSFEHQF